jgi:hypothetical protein
VTSHTCAVANVQSFSAPPPTGFTEIVRDDFPVLETHIRGALRLSGDRAFFVSSYFLSELHAFFPIVDDERVVSSQC